MSADQLPPAPEHGILSTVTYGELPGSFTITTAPLTSIDTLEPGRIADVAEEAHPGLGTSLMNAVASGIPWKTVAMKLLVLAAEEFIAWAKDQPSQTPPVNQ